jgi:hypothetical protein
MMLPCGRLDPMSSAGATRRSATAADLLAIPEPERFHEIVGGELIRKAAPSGPHGRAQARVASKISGPYDRRAGGTKGKRPAAGGSSSRSRSHSSFMRSTDPTWLAPRATVRATQ